ncbi:hypothetical protein PSET11_02965 [Arthrobacter ulcerisalmonis]|uniref:Ig-like domain-containing protein n=3 Tax=Arthrobacter ulcerisalmonis TaxID=2483813 RepID=A0A3P5XSY1_9MICC|nr:DUF4082 domain-containing protein [Arthrobacter ulcerisalmonis]VDC32177.1 hypothetical protein PSET11_02965 [Arthrobacter ulcerisalmonis]
MPVSPAKRPLTPFRRIVIPLAFALVASLLPLGLPAAFLAAASAADPCAPLVNTIACENSKPGAPADEWDINGAGDDSIQGFSTEMSINAGQPVQFKVDTKATNYTIAIYRTGWYQGLGARKVADVTPSALRQTQPQCLTDLATELYDCGTWAVSATWNVPSTAVSGVYFALLTRPDTGGQSHITFVVRNDSSHSDVVFQTSDPTWQAYNTYGGSDFYQGASNGRAYKISYNRPVVTRGASEGRDFYFSNEYPMVRFMEKNGYDVSYISGLDTDRSGGLLLNHKVFLSVGHDEYWSGNQRTNVEAARDAGVNLQFLSGNEVYWRVRYEPSPVNGAAHRTITSYKETWANGKIDPSTQWTGTWRDPRFASQANGAGLPENALTGTLYMSNYTDLPITVSAAEGKTRLWRNTSLTSLAANTTAALAPHTIGYESDEDLDNGFRPAGLIKLSTTTGPTSQYLRDFGNVVTPGTTTHNLTLYRAASGALVFGAGTVQWTWGLDQNHDGQGAAADPRMQQAQINLFADMGAQPGTRDTALAAAAASTDTTGPTATITSPAENASLAHGVSVTATGTAADVGGVVAGVEVSTDGGTSWHPAQGKQNWTYTYIQKGLTTTTLKVRAVDDSANIGATATRNLQLTGPYSVFGQQVPETVDANDGGAYELGMRITPSVDGFITGARFYKSAANTGTHVASLWNAAGQRLTTATYTSETASGWQKVTFPQTIAVTAGTTYTISYTAPKGHYASKDYQWASFGMTDPPLTVAGGFGAAPAGVYGSPDTFPTNNFGNGNYFVDALFDTTDNTPLSAVNQFPLPGASSVPQAATVGATFSRPVTPASVTLTLKTAAGASVAGATAYDATARKVTFTPSAALALGTSYTATLTGTATGGGALTAGGSWSFTTVVSAPTPGSCPCSFFDESTTPSIAEIKDGVPLTLGTRFTSTANGTVTGVKFYKSAGNTGTHVGTLWSAAGQQLASVTFANESSSGWQTAYFNQPVTMSANTEYLVAYKSPTGTYSATGNGFGNGLSVGNLRTGSDAGAYSYSTDFPGSRSNASYLVDVVVQYADSPFTGTAQQPLAGSSSVPLNSTTSAVLSKPAVASSVSIAVTGPGNTAVAGATTYDATTRKATFTPTTPLATATTYTATLTATSTTGQALSAGITWTFTTVPPARTEGTCPCTLYQDTVTPTTNEINDGVPLTLGTRFASNTAGTITGIRFYKSAGNTGTHTGALYTTTGQQLATITFTNETTAGWQTATFNQPVTITANTEYIAAYTTPNGVYSATSGGFSTGFTSGPLRTTEGSGAFISGSAYPANGSSASYLVDVVFSTVVTPPPPPPAPAALTVSAQTPAPNATNIARDATPTLTLSAPVRAGSSVQLTVAGVAVAGTSAISTDNKTITFSPTNLLPANTQVTARAVTVVSTDGATLPATSWVFTTANPANQSMFATVTPASSNILNLRATEVGVSFRTTRTGLVTAIRFYKGLLNTGTHTGSLWDSTGTRLIRATFTNESLTGWQSVTLATPIRLAANTDYVVSYNAPTGRYSYTTNYFSQARTSGYLTAAATRNGLYAFGTGATVPNLTSSATNYFVDIVFSPAS